MLEMEQLRAGAGVGSFSEGLLGARLGPRPLLWSLGSGPGWQVPDMLEATGRS